MKKRVLVYSLVCLTSVTTQTMHRAFTFRENVRQLPYKYFLSRKHPSRFCATFQESKTYRVTETCYQNIQKINEDGEKLYYFLKGSFHAMGEQCHERNEVHKPSEFLRFLSSASNIDQDTQLSYMLASHYLELIISEYYEDLDRAFLKKFKETNDIKEAYEWFAEYFKRKGIAEPLAELKTLVAENNQDRVELQEKGIFFSSDGKTVIIVPNCAKE